MSVVRHSLFVTRSRQTTNNQKRKTLSLLHWPMTYKTLRLDSEDNALRITLERPEVLNALLAGVVSGT